LMEAVAVWVSVMAASCIIGGWLPIRRVGPWRIVDDAP
jgi:hypothetical protein